MELCPPRMWLLFGFYQGLLTAFLPLCHCHCRTSESLLFFLAAFWAFFLGPGKKELHFHAKHDIQCPLFAVWAKILRIGHAPVVPNMVWGSLPVGVCSTSEGLSHPKGCSVLALACGSVPWFSNSWWNPMLYYKEFGTCPCALKSRDNGDTLTF